jgi:hypothetical protein
VGHSTKRTLTSLGRVATLTLALGWAITGCGAVSSPPSTNNGAAAASPTATARVPGSSTLNGCVTQPPPAAATTPADVTVKLAVAETRPSVTVQKGQTLDILLPAVYRWRLSAGNLGTTLRAVGSGGWYDTASESCVWRFTAANVGTIPLDFGGSPVCAPDTKCPALALAVSYIVIVK